MTAEYIRQLEDAALTLWAEVTPEQWSVLHHSIEHEQAMVRRNVWGEP